MGIEGDAKGFLIPEVGDSRLSGLDTAIRHLSSEVQEEAEADCTTK